MKKLAIITTHPIQYYAPLFRMLTTRGKIHPKVFYTWSQAREKVEDKGFGKDISWDIPLLDGYEYEFIKNIGNKPNSRSFWSLHNPTLINKIKDFQPDAILVFGWNYRSHLNVMRHFKGKIPVFFRGDSHLLDEKPGIKTILRRLFLTWIYWHIDKAFYVGTHNKNYYLKHGVKENQLIFAPHAIDNARFLDNGENKYEVKALLWRRKLGYKDEDIIILFAGKLYHVKNPELLINAVHKINCTNQHENSIHLLIIGNGQLEGDLKKLAENHLFIKFLPFQNQSLMPLIYRLGDLFVLPSKSETWGLVINEALASGRPVVVSDKVGCAVDLVNHLNGRVFKSNHPDELCNAIMEMINNKIKTKELAKECVSSIKDWSFENISKALEGEFNK